MIKNNTHVILGLGAIFLLPASMILTQFPTPELIAQSETTLESSDLSFQWDYWYNGGSENCTNSTLISWQTGAD